MTSLKKLDISYNDFENGSPPPILAELSELEDLNLASCNLHSFPDRLAWHIISVSQNLTNYFLNFIWSFINLVVTSKLL